MPISLEAHFTSSSTMTASTLYQHPTQRPLKKTETLCFLSMTTNKIATSAKDDTREGSVPSSTREGQLQQSASKKNTLSGAKKRNKLPLKRTSPNKYWILQDVEPAGSLELPATMDVDQEYALETALSQLNYASSQARIRRQNSDALNKMKEHRRREQNRKSQVAYRERQRKLEYGLVRGVKSLRREIESLEIRKASGIISVGSSLPKEQAESIQSIGDIYYSLKCGLSRQCLPSVQTYRQTFGCSPALELLLDLQREEFESVASFELHWLWYSTQFRVFQFSAMSFERLEAGEKVIIKVTGQLWLDVYYDRKKGRGKKAGYGEIICPVLQQFEFENGEQVATRITSEVDLVAGVAASQSKSDPADVLSTLHCLSEAFCIDNCRRN